MESKHLLLLVACLGLLSELRLTSTTTTTTFVAAMSLANQDLERYFRTVNASQTLAAMAEERIALDMYTYAYLNYSYRDAQQQLVERAFSEEKARYGEGRVLDVNGLLVHITDVSEADSAIVMGSDYACSPNILGTRGEPFPGAGERWIALVRRGRCTFEEKVMHVHGKGAAGVIIYNDKPVSNLEKMQIKGKNRNITAVITYQDIGQDMARVVDQGIKMKAAIIVGHSGMRPLNTMNRTSVLFVSISFIVLMIISLVWLVFYYIQRFRYLQSKDQQSRHLCSVTKKAIMKIPTKTGKTSDEKDADSDCCAICIEAYKTSDCIRVLPCKHEFHKNCIDPWLIEHRTCPMCKLDVLKFYGYVFLDSEESILEIDPDRQSNRLTSSTAGLTPMIGTAAAGATASAHVQSTEGVQPRSSRALTDLIRNSRDFVIDFPRIFVLEASGSHAPPSALFPDGMPERSQSTLSLAHAKDWMSMMSNKLEEQQGLQRLRKSSVRYELQENLLSVRNDSVRRHRSRSADARYTNVFFTRKSAAATVTATTTAAEDEHPPQPATTDDSGEGAAIVTAVGRQERRRSSAALRLLTDASYAQSIQRRREELQQRAAKRRSSVVTQTPGSSQQQQRTSRASVVAIAATPAECNASDVAIRIQLNGEGMDF